MRSKLTQLVRRLEEIDQNLQDPDVTSNMDQFRALSKERAEIEPVVLKAKEYERAEEDLAAAEEMLSDEEMKEFASEEIKAAKKTIEQISSELEILLLPKDPNDDKNIYLEIRAGTGGDESALFAGDLFRMYSRYAERQKWQVEFVSASPSDLGGYKEIVVKIVGQGAYSKLKFESGGHRVQRVPETESQGRVHTSACTVAVLPEADEIGDVVIDPSELRIDVYRASGAGGQHIQKTDSAVRITHIPTGIVAVSQTSRSQHQNKEEAMTILKSRLYEAELRKRQATQQALEDNKSDISWGHQIRSYVLDQSRVKDLRTNVETGNTTAVLDGALEPFIEASLKQGV